MTISGGGYHMNQYKGLPFSPKYYIKLLARKAKARSAGKMWTSPIPNDDTLYGAGDNLIIPNAVIPETFFDSMRNTTAFEPERRLMLAVLKDAVMSYNLALSKVPKNRAASGKVSRSARNQILRREKFIEECEEWFSGSEGSWPFNFENICGALDITPSYLRKGINEWKKIILESKGERTMSHFHRNSVESSKHHKVVANRSWKRRRA